MSSDKRFGLLRRVLQAFGLPQESVDDVVTWIADLLAGKGKETEPVEILPYRLRDNFLSAAEMGFYGVLKTVVGDRAALALKVGLNDLFGVKSEDQSQFRIYTNKIDRKHVDFLLCDPQTMRPLVAIELDDKSHQRADRQARDEFVDKVFKAAGLPILHIPAKRGYVVSEIAALLAPYFGQMPAQPVVAPASAPAPRPQSPAPAPTATAKAKPNAPVCPKCGGAMVMRVAKSGPNAGNRFWGCSNYPNCHHVMAVTE